jgi:hypothetical protein
MNESATLPTHRKVTATLGISRRKKNIIAALISGNSGMSHKCSRKYPVGITPPTRRKN